MRMCDIPGIDKLSAAEKILLVEDLWDHITLDKSNVPIPPSRVEELERRLKNHEANLGNLLSLEEIQRGIESRK